MSEFLQQLVNGVTWGSVYALIALGYTMVYGILKLINFAHGDVFMLGSFGGFYIGNFVAARTAGASGTPSAGRLFFVMLASMLFCGIFGYLNERIAYRPLRNA